MVRYMSMMRTLRNFHSEGFKIKNSSCWLCHHSFVLFQTIWASSSQKTLHPLCLLRPASDFFKEENGYVNASVERLVGVVDYHGEHPVTRCWGVLGRVKTPQSKYNALFGCHFQVQQMRWYCLLPWFTTRFPPKFSGRQGSRLDTVLACDGRISQWRQRHSMLARRIYVFDSKSAVECPLPLSKFVMAEGPLWSEEKNVKTPATFLRANMLFQLPWQAGMSGTESETIKFKLWNQLQGPEQPYSSRRQHLTTAWPCMFSLIGSQYSTAQHLLQHCLG